MNDEGHPFERPSANVHPPSTLAHRAERDSRRAAVVSRTPLQLALQPIASEVRALGATGSKRELHVARDLVDRIFAAELSTREAA